MLCATRTEESYKGMARNLELPVVDFSSDDRASAAKSIRLACLEYGFFYLVNHGIGREVLGKVFEESKKFFSLPPSEKMKLALNEGHRGYTPPFAEKLDPSLQSKGFPFLCLILAFLFLAC